MMTMRGIFAVTALIGVAACAQPQQLSVEKAWVRLAAVKGGPAAGYFTIHGGPSDATLINVTTDVAIRSEMHESMSAGGVSSMKPIARVEIPAKTDVVFAPGGRHVMLFDVNPGIKPGERTITFTLTFADGTRILQNAAVVGAGDTGTK